MGTNKTFFVFNPILLKLGEVVVHYTLALSTPPRITIGFPMQNAEGPNIAKLSKNREFFENQ